MTSLLKSFEITGIEEMCVSITKACLLLTLIHQFPFHAAFLSRRLQINSMRSYWLSHAYGVGVIFYKSNVHRFQFLLISAGAETLPSTDIKSHLTVTISEWQNFLFIYSSPSTPPLSALQFSMDL